MMEATSLFPEGHHPVLTRRTPDLQGFARQYTRQGAFPPVRYLFIDFGLSSHIPPGQSRLVVGVFSQDKEVPELSRTVPYDAFKLDVFVLGNVFRRHIHDVSAFSIHMPLSDSLSSCSIVSNSYSRSCVK